MNAKVRRLVLSHVRRVLRGYSELYAEDVVQEVLLFHHQRDAESWNLNHILKTATRKALDLVRSERARAMREGRYAEQLRVMGQAPSALSPSRPPSNYDIWILFENGFSENEIGKLYGLSIDTIKRSIKNGKTRIH